MELLPAIDIKDGQCVRLYKGDFDTVHKVAEDPVAVAASYRDAGARLIHVVDLDGAKDGVGKNAHIIGEIVKAAAPAKVELGGGLRTLKDIEAADALGVWRFILGSVAVEDRDVTRQAVERYHERIAVGIDAQGGMVKTRGWIEQTQLSAVDFAAQMQGMGVSTIIFTDIDTDGLLSGPSADSLKELRAALTCNLVASGGVSSLDDVRELRRLGADGCIVGKALYSGRLELKEGLFEGRYGQLFEKSELIPAIIQHVETKEVLMLGYMNRESLDATLNTGLATFWSRSRKTLWVKGETSNNFLRVKEISTDCDDDTLLLRCLPDGPVCHTGKASCFYKSIGESRV